MIRKDQAVPPKFLSQNFRVKTIFRKISEISDTGTGVGHTLTVAARLCVKHTSATSMAFSDDALLLLPGTWCP